MSKEPQAAPFIKWVGGKRKIVNQLIEHIPDGLNDYYEPFLGGGALFFNVRGRFNKYFLSDINLDLVTSYNAIKKNPEEVGKLLDQHESKHCKEYYYHVGKSADSNNPYAISSRFLYLNRHSFRGIYRLNINGKMNVSCSDREYKSKLSDKIKQSSVFLENSNIFAGDFSFIEPNKNDFVYFDPPYHRSGEKFYTRLAFDESEQLRLKEFVDVLSIKGVKIMLSNSNTDFIKTLYKNYNINILEVKYNLRMDSKTKKEVLITNY